VCLTRLNYQFINALLRGAEQRSLIVYRGFPTGQYFAPFPVAAAELDLSEMSFMV
jgi:hypothetical protein